MHPAGLLDLYPELGTFRDIVFYLKAMMVPSGDALPEMRAWAPEDAKLQWSSWLQTASTPSDDTAPSLPPPGASWGSGRAYGTPERRLGSSEACGGLGWPASACSEGEASPLSTNRRAISAPRCSARSSGGGCERQLVESGLHPA